MNRFSINRFKYFAVLVLSLVLLSACATTVVPESNIEDRVQARWDIVIKDDLAGAYEFLSPGYRSSVSSANYQRSLLLSRVRWTNAEYMSSECEETACKVKVRVGFTISGALPGVNSYSNVHTVHESWVLADGEWYFVPES